MKTIFLTILMAAFYATSVFAQFNISANAGLSISETFNEKSDLPQSNADPIFRPTIGAEFSFPLIAKLWLASGLNFSQVGKKNSVNENSNFTNSAFSASIPVAIQYRFQKIGFIAGPEIVVLWNEKTKSEGSETSSNNFDETDLGFRLGVSYNLTNRIAIEANNFFSFQYHSHLEFYDDSNQLVDRLGYDRFNVFRFQVKYDLIQS